MKCWNSQKGRFEPVSNCGFYNENCAHPNLKIIDKNITDPTEQWIDRAFQVYSQIDQVEYVFRTVLQPGHLLVLIEEFQSSKFIRFLYPFNFSRTRTSKSIFFGRQNDHEEVLLSSSELSMNIWMAMDRIRHFPRTISSTTYFTNAMSATVDAIWVS